MSLFVISLLCIPLMKRGEISQEQAIIEAFNVSDAKVMKTSVLCEGTLHNKYWSRNQPEINKLQVVAEDVLRSFGTCNNTSVQREQNMNDYYMEYSIFAQIDENQYLNVKTWSEKRSSDSFEGFINIELFQDDTTEYLKDSKEKLEKIVGAYFSDKHIMSSIVGVYDGKLNNEQFYELSNRLFNKTSSKQVYYVEKDNTVSAFSYSPQYKDFSMINDKKANIELSVRYHSYEDTTYIMLSTPPQS